MNEPKRPLVLIIDDDDVFTDTLQFVLRQKEYNMCSATNGEEGIEVAIERKPDVILCDVRMHGMHVYATVQVLKDQLETSKVPVIMMSGYATGPFGEKRCLMAGADYYLSKPFSAFDLIYTLERALQQGTIKRRSSDLILPSEGF